MSTELQPRTREPLVLATVEHQLRQNHRLMLLPPAASTVTVMSGGWMHDRLMATLAVGGPEMLLIGLGGGAVAAVISTGLATLYAARAGALVGLPPGKKLFGGSAATGLALAVFGDVSLIVLGTYAAGLFGLSRWYRTRWTAGRVLKEHRKALTAAPVVQEPEAPEPVGPEIVDAVIVDPDEFITRWARGAVKHLPDTELIPLRGSGLAYIVQAGPNGVTLEAANTAREKIAGALRLALPGPNSAGQDLVFDQPTDGTLTDRSQLRAQILDLATAAAASRRVTPLLTHAPGNPCAVRIGGYIDDGGDYYWTFADGDGAHSGVLLGGSGMGKSSTGDNLGYQAMRLGFQIAYLDPQRGASSPVLAKYANYPALGPEYFGAFLRFLEDCADTRETWMAMHEGVGTITWNMTAPCAPTGSHPDPGCPCGGEVPDGLAALIEECDQVFNALIAGTNTKLAERFGALAKRIRKLNMCMIALTQMPELKTFGNSEMLRSNLPLRNLLAMHIASNVSGTLIPGLPYSPKLLPKVPGRGLACGQDTRSMQVGLDYMPRRQKAVECVEGPFAEDLFEALPPARRYAPDRDAWQRHLPEVATNAAHANRAAARARFAAKQSGVIAPPPPPAPTPPSPRTAQVAGVMQWPKPVVSAGPVAEMLRAVRDLGDDEWVTAGELARRLGRVPDEAEDGVLRARARAVGAELALKGIELEKRPAGMSTTAGRIRAVWS